MAKDETKSPKADRLRQAVERVRVAQRAASVIPQAKDSHNSSAGTPQRAIKYSKASTALRHHAAEAQKTKKPASTVRLIVRQPPVPTQDVPRETARLHRPATPSLSRADPPGTREVAIATALDLGEIVHRARRRQGLSQAELAHAAGTGRRFVSELEAGKPTLELERALHVCAALGLSVSATAPGD